MGHHEFGTEFDSYIRVKLSQLRQSFEARFLQIFKCSFVQNTHLLNEQIKRFFNQRFANHESSTCSRGSMDCPIVL